MSAPNTGGLHSTIYELESERALYAATIDRLLVGTVILDENGKVMKSNQAASGESPPAKNHPIGT
jgi:hypothetical protein